MTGAEQKVFLESLKKLEEGFSEGGHHGESDREIAEAMIKFVIERERLRRGVAAGTPSGVAVDMETLTQMAGWDSDDPAMLVLEKVFRRLATGRGNEAVVLLKRVITDRALAVSQAQRRRASAPREQHPVQELIERIVATRPGISAKELERALRNEEGKEVIFDMDDVDIHPRNENFKVIKVSGLRDRLTDARKKIAKAG